MLGGVLTFAVAFATSWSLTVPIRRMALQWGIVDMPNPRKIHRTPIPLLGGVAIYCGTVFAIMGFVESRARGQIFGILAASTLLLIVGILDDRHLLHHQVKLFVAMPLGGCDARGAGGQDSRWFRFFARPCRPHPRHWGSLYSGWWESPPPTTFSITWTVLPAE